MKYWVFILTTSVMILACTQVPIIAVIPYANTATLNCERIFPSARWQQHHLIQATVGGRSMGRLTGVSVISPQTGTLECALMTIEGLVLFSARYDGQLKVARAIAPFDRPGFADGLMADLRLLYFKPDVPLRAYGRLSDSNKVCRYSASDGAVTDIVVQDAQHWAIRTYSVKGRRQRTIEAAGTSPGNGPARYLTIQNHGLIEYVLKLELIEAAPLDE